MYVCVDTHRFVSHHLTVSSTNYEPIEKMCKIKR